MKISESVFRDYFKALVLGYVYILLLRSLEYYWVSVSHIVENLLWYELSGLIVDFLIFNTLSVLIIAVQYSFRNSRPGVLNGFIISFIALFSLFHILILKYYVYILKPVDQMLFNYSFRELFFTVSTTELNYAVILILIVILISIALFLPGLLAPIHISAGKFKWIFLAILISIPLSFYSLRKIDSDHDDIRKNARVNKSVYFYRRTFSYLFNLHRDINLTSEHIYRFRSAFTGKDYISEEYPMLHAENYNDVLGNYFNTSDTLPNLVFIIVEGLGQRFLDTFHGVRLMPYLDSLAGQSLYWDRFFTTAERSFGVVPSLTGSLPYGENGFTSLDQLPRHLSMISLFKKYGYQSHFFYGQASWFDRKGRFLKANNIDLIFDKSEYSPKYKKVMALGGKFFWGYQDQDLFRQSLEVLDTLSSGPRIDLYFTGSMHSPFPTDNPKYYNEELDSLTGSSGISAWDQKYIDKYRKYIITVMFFDHALEQFMTEYAKRDDFNNTIFFITGDHPMTEIPIENSLRRYHVPLIIYSPMLKRSKNIHATGSHLDVYPCIQAFMRDNYNLSIPDATMDLGYCLDTMQNFRNNSLMPFMDANREVIDYLENGYYISQGKGLYAVDSNFNLSAINDPLKSKQLLENLDAFKRVNLYACVNDRLIPDSIYFSELCYDKIWSQSKDTLEISESTEYIPVQPELTMSNPRELYYDFSYTLEFDPDDPLPIGVIQINNEADSIILWQSFQLDETLTGSGMVLVKRHNKINTMHFTDSIFHINMYLWNNENARGIISNFNATLYQLSDCH